MALLTDVDSNIDRDEIVVPGLSGQDAQAIATWVNENAIVLQRMLAKLKNLSSAYDSDAINAGLVNNTFGMVFYPVLKYFDAGLGTEVDFIDYYSHGIVTLVEDPNFGNKFIKVEGTITAINDPFLQEDGYPTEDNTLTGSYCFIALPAAAELIINEYFSGAVNAMFIEPTSSLGDGVYNFLCGVIGTDGIVNKRARLFYAYTDTGVSEVRGFLPSFFSVTSSFSFSLMYPIDQAGFTELVAAYTASYATGAGSLIVDGDTGAWTGVTAPIKSQNIVYDLLILDGVLYASMGPKGNLFKLSGLVDRETSLQSWNGSSAWAEVVEQIAGQTQINGLVKFSGKLYATGGTSGILMELATLTETIQSLTLWNGTSSFSQAAPRLNDQDQINGLVVLSSNLYATGGTSGVLLKFDGTNMVWTQVAPQLGTITIVDSPVVLSGVIYGAANDGRLVKWNGSNLWVEVCPALATLVSARQTVNLSGVIYGLLQTAAQVATGLGVLYHSNGSVWSNTTPATPAVTVKYLLVVGSTLFALAGIGGNGVLYKYVGTATWTQVSGNYTTADGTAICAFGTDIWAAHDNGVVTKVAQAGAGTAWTTVATITGKNIRSLFVHNSKMYAGTLDGLLYEWDNVSAFVNVAPTLNSSLAIAALITFNSSLYAGLSA